MDHQSPFDACRVGDNYSLTDHILSSDRLAYINGTAVELLTVSDDLPRVLHRDLPFRGSRGRLGLNVSCPLAWTPDGNTLFHSHDQLVSIDTETGGSSPITAFSTETRGSVRWQLKCFPDGRSLIFLKGPGLLSKRSGPLRVCTVPCRGGRVRPLVGAIVPKSSLRAFETCWRRDLIVAKFEQPTGSSLWSVRLNGDAREKVYESKDIGAFSINKAGTAIAFEHGLGIVVLDSSRGTTRELVASGRLPSWSPDGLAVAYMVNDAELSIVDVATRRRQSVITLQGDIEAGLGSYAQRPVWSDDGRKLWFTVTALIGPPGDWRHRISRRVGIVDFNTNKILMRSGYWNGVAWAPKC
jgi:hypothetical protein